MARKKHKGSGARFVALRHYMLNSAAWRDLDANSRALYIEIARRYMGQNNGRIPYSVREGAAELRISTATVSRSLNKLIDHGFIIPTKKGAFDFKKRHATEWRLTEHDYGNEFATKDFMRWSQPAQANSNTSPVLGDTLSARTTW
jgi:DNA-binding transcriptional regulator YhcF (GntR family)